MCHTKNTRHADWNDVIHGELIWDENEGDVQRDVHFVNCTSKVMKLAQEGAIGIETAVCQLAGIGRRKQIRTCVMLDSGATHTYIDEDLANELNESVRDISERLIVKQKTIRVLLDTGSSGDLLFVRKGSQKYIPTMKEATEFFKPDRILEGTIVISCTYLALRLLNLELEFQKRMVHVAPQFHAICTWESVPLERIVSKKDQFP